jgi:hypothetical protein
VENCWCLEGGLNETMAPLCTSLGDCGVKKNYLGVYGFND